MRSGLRITTLLALTCATSLAAGCPDKQGDGDADTNADEVGTADTEDTGPPETSESDTTTDGTTDDTTTDDATTDATTDDTTDDETTTDTAEDDGACEVGNFGGQVEVTPHGGFVPPTDLPVQECDSFLQDCPDGEKCVPYASGGGNWDALKCVPVMGDAAPGEACNYGGIVEATDDCDAGSYCWGVDDNQQGTCAAFCTGTPEDPMCPEGSTCIQSNEVIALCVEGCNPIDQNCGPDDGCYWTGDTFNCVFTTTDLAEGEECGFINDCAPGNMCVSAGSVPNCAGSACCASFCDLDCRMPCELPGTTCVPFFEQGMTPMGYEDVGVCLSPP